ncbi:(2Fe-2S)-binding protein [Leisingera daeponensis]|uniref:(2Fe-2S)-binding protein n=1 Tax=Leisingera daeponensis TaxID=405746 RepID=UPI001C98A860|nr:(2Fe-2S)-binding protein [Leisingera daeponensis]MBY6059147.1 (2Fe-2S)-binding protein [Leisingera daeponensis]
MKIASRFLTLPETGRIVYLTIDGEPVTARAGDTVAAALLAHSGNPSRHSATGAPRTVFCMMGVCFECLIEIDGRPNCQGCMIRVRDGMALRRQVGLRSFAQGPADV